VAGNGLLSNEARFSDGALVRVEVPGLAPWGRTGDGARTFGLRWVGQPVSNVGNAALGFALTALAFAIPVLRGVNRRERPVPMAGPLPDPPNGDFLAVAQPDAVADPDAVSAALANAFAVREPPDVRQLVTIVRTA